MPSLSWITAYTMDLKHPYFPANASITDFKPNDIDMFTILLGLFGSVTIAVVLFAGCLLRGYKASGWRKLALCWLLSSGCIHTILEGHFCIYSADIASKMDFLSQICKLCSANNNSEQNMFLVCLDIAKMNPILICEFRAPVWVLQQLVNFVSLINYYVGLICS